MQAIPVWAGWDGDPGAQAEGVQAVVGGAGVDHSVGHRGGIFGGLGGGEAPQPGAGGGVQGVDVVIVRAGVDHAVGYRRRGLGEASSGEGPQLRRPGRNGPLRAERRDKKQSARTRSLAKANFWSYRIGDMARLWRWTSICPFARCTRGADGRCPAVRVSFWFWNSAVGRLRSPVLRLCSLGQARTSGSPTRGLTQPWRSCALRSCSCRYGAGTPSPLVIPSADGDEQDNRSRSCRLPCWALALRDPYPGDLVQGPGGRRRCSW